ncbi:TraR/DksA family transcriptional regulator [Motilibacter aurantiacus]|uniref:TraR/DksA family transcriptional regulator n=1 Tax=Motilibacter aurantiacus TaxID=2714955 RepID=UPI00140D950B|nr:hypothetical protein [Motilibacter aurantiacus]NHC46576.1 hypothetical protein [Motilibacter aurantiacus]
MERRAVRAQQVGALVLAVLVVLALAPQSTSGAADARPTGDVSRASDAPVLDAAHVERAPAARLSAAREHLEGTAPAVPLAAGVLLLLLLPASCPPGRRALSRSAGPQRGRAPPVAPRLPREPDGHHRTRRTCGAFSFSSLWSTPMSISSATPRVDARRTPAADPLTPAQLAELRVELERCRAERREQLAAQGAEPAAGDLVLAAHLDSVRSVLREIEAALARMAAGTYGVCVSCSARIPAPRLELRPYPPGCVDCARRDAAGR